MSDFFQSIADICNNCLDSIVSAYQYLSSGVSSLLSVPAIFPSIWAIFPSSFTSVIIAVICVSLGATLILTIINRV